MHLAIGLGGIAPIGEVLVDEQKVIAAEDVLSRSTGQPRWKVTDDDRVHEGWHTRFQPTSPNTSASRREHGLLAVYHRLLILTLSSLNQGLTLVYH